MIRKFIALSLLAVLASALPQGGNGGNANPSSTPALSIPSCAQGCIGGISNGGCASNDIACLCRTQNYVDAWESCVISSCTDGTDIIQGIAEAQGACGALGITATQTTVTSAVAAAFGSATSAGGSAAVASASSISASASAVAQSIASVDTNNTAAVLSSQSASLSSAASAASATLSSISARLASSLSAQSSSLSAAQSSAHSATSSPNAANGVVRINIGSVSLISIFTGLFGLIGGGFILFA